jgi:hypothetical protein
MFSLKQKGLSPIGILFAVCVFAFLIMVALKLTNHYVDYNSIRRSFSDEAKIPGIKDAGKEKMMVDIAKQLTINNIQNFDLRGSSYLTEEDGVKVLGFEYEVREHLFANIDVVLSFDYEVELE